MLLPARGDGGRAPRPSAPALRARPAACLVQYLRYVLASCCTATLGISLFAGRAGAPTRARAASPPPCSSARPRSPSSSSVGLAVGVLAAVFGAAPSLDLLHDGGRRARPVDRHVLARADADPRRSPSPWRLVSALRLRHRRAARAARGHARRVLRRGAARLTRSGMLEVARRRTIIRTARAKGLAERLSRCSATRLRNALIPITHRARPPDRRAARRRRRHRDRVRVARRRARSCSTRSLRRDYPLVQAVDRRARGDLRASSTSRVDLLYAWARPAGCAPVTRHPHVARRPRLRRAIRSR